MKLTEEQIKAVLNEAVQKTVDSFRATEMNDEDYARMEKDGLDEWDIADEKWTEILVGEYEVNGVPYSLESEMVSRSILKVDNLSILIDVSYDNYGKVEILSDGISEDEKAIIMELVEETFDNVE